MGVSTRIDERVYAMENMKSMPIKYLMLYIYPNLYPLHYQFDLVTNPPIPLQLSFANIDRNGVYLLDTYDHLFIYICKSVHPQFLADVFNVTQWSQIPDECEQNTTTMGNTLQRTNPPQVNGFIPNSGDNQPYSPTTLHNNNENQNHNYSHEANQLIEPETKSNTHLMKTPVINLPYFDNPTSQRIHAFINSLIEDRPFKPNFHILR